MVRTTLRSLLSRKARVVLSGLAVVLGVMFVSGSFVLTDTMSHAVDRLFATAYAGVDVDVAAKPKTDNPAAMATVPAGLLTQVRSTPGVASATGIVRVD